ncbi:hypothetical protein Tsubulata_006250 [Turnera subulata]|uniref:RING-type domain-containing protein n=1 Tax=Turnera subulata TaxID=218843 RepID=A0A9Q0FLW1_9ROSI|nr:hypothetical protein Tsubulata_006250 [Turnera subulata]
MPPHNHHHGGAPPPPPKPNQKLLSLILKAIIMTVITTLFFVFLGVAAIVLLLATAALHRHSAPSSSSSSSSSDASSSNGLSPKDLRRLPRFRFPARKWRPEEAAAADQQPPCVVCLDGFREGQWCRKLDGCGHVFHRRCVDSWLVKVPACPICRAQVRVDGGEEDGRHLWGFGWRDEIRIW